MSCKISLMVSVDIKHHVYLLRTCNRAHEMCESRGGGPGLPVPNKIQDSRLLSHQKNENVA